MEHTYPITVEYINKTSDSNRKLVIKFTGIKTGECIVAQNEPGWEVGKVNGSLIPHTDTHTWKPVRKFKTYIIRK